MRLGRLAAGGLVTGALVGFVVALVRPRRRASVVDEPYTEDRAGTGSEAGSEAGSTDGVAIELPREPADAPTAPYEGQGPH